MSGRFSKLLVFILGALAVLSAAQACKTAMHHPRGSIDIGMSLKAAQLLLEENPYRRHLRDGAGRIQEPHSGANPFPMMPMQVPSALMLLWPYSGLSWPTAKLAWLLSNLVFTAGALTLAVKRFLPGRSICVYAFLGSLLLISSPWRTIVGNGQHLVAAMFFFLAAAELADRGHRAWAGVAVALSFVKYTITLFLLPYFIWKRQWRLLLIALAIHVLMTFAVAAWLNENPLTLVQQAISAASGQLSSSGYVDLFALAKSLGTPVTVPATLALLLVLGAAALGLRPDRRDEHCYLALLCFVSFLAVYHRLYDAVILLLPLLVMVPRLRSDPLLAGMVLASVGGTWFVERTVLAIAAAVPNAGGDGLISLTQLAIALVLYSTLLLLFYRQFKSGGATSTEGQEPESSSHLSRRSIASDHSG